MSDGELGGVLAGQVLYAAYFAECGGLTPGENRVVLPCWDWLSPNAQEAWRRSAKTSLDLRDVMQSWETATCEAVRATDEDARHAAAFDGIVSDRP